MGKTGEILTVGIPRPYKVKKIFGTSGIRTRIPRTRAQCLYHCATSALYEIGARVIIGCRDEERGKMAVEAIKKDTGLDIVFMKLDLASFDSVRSFANELHDNEQQIH